MTTTTQIPLRVEVRRLLADTYTPVSLYLRLRDHYTDPVLLESNDISNKEECFSFLGLDTLASFQVKNGRVRTQVPGEDTEVTRLVDTQTVPDALRAFLRRFEPQGDAPFREFNGLFGHTGFDGVQYFDTLHFDQDKRRFDLPDLRYHLYRFIIAINHYKDELYLLENLLPGEESRLEELQTRIENPHFRVHPFRVRGEETSNLTDEEFRNLVRIGKMHCQRGDVFQIVFSRQFQQAFEGDEFQVYRVLRSVNPSPYLFYFDYGDYRIFGSSPEAQMVIRKGVATLNPIAGTYRRTGNTEEDVLAAEALQVDPKENAEHIMLVDLARNDLGRHARNVQVKELKDIHYYSHVIHLVSRVTGDLDADSNPIRIFGDTFPAGTLSGAPKYKAIELINQYENQNRAFYGGALGYIDFNGEMNQAIVIRSFLSQDNTLFYQAGAGVVVTSEEEKELQEVNNKLGALKKALLEAERLG
ncbi:MAG: anthranilate synthase component I [Bacteroidetes bacterium]|nr:MAG: anthranilate synthase component I [Bacteroidota bacterium]PTM13155.1 MAG: anthranilate synthase component I [Bacteroidota bacterium]